MLKGIHGMLIQISTFKYFDLARLLAISGLFCLLSACNGETEQNKTVDPSSITFAILGDYGYPGNETASSKVSKLVKSWQPQFIATVGDNNYPSGEASTIDANVGQYYSDYIFPYKGKFGKGSADGKNHFYPTIGNHDSITDAGRPYFDYFSLVNGKANYDIDLGLVHLVIMNSNGKNRKKSPQGIWVKNTLQNSQAKWKIVLLHHPPISSGRKYGYGDVRWPFKDWGATTVIAGHEHFYERLERSGIPYFINGLGGAGMHKFQGPRESSIVRYNEKHGAMRVTADDNNIRFEFINIDNEIVDRFDYPFKG
jgi:tartrate-resistant acid phosphatase type 5